MTIVTTSASPKVTLGPAKAIIAGVLGAVTSIAPVLTLAIQDGVLDVGEGVGLLVALLVGLGVPGVGTYLAPTKVAVTVPESQGPAPETYNPGSGAYG